MFFLAKKLFAGSVKQFGVLHYFHLKCHCEKYPREKLADIKLWIPTLRVFVNFDEMALFSFLTLTTSTQDGGSWQAFGERK